MQATTINKIPSKQKTPFYEKKWFYILLLIVLILSMVSFALKQKTLKLLKEQQAGWGDITPGFTTIQDLERVSQFNNLIRSFETELGNVVVEFESDYPTKPSEVVFSPNGTVEKIVEQASVENPEYINRYLEEYGEPNYSSLLSGNATETCSVYLLIGIAIVHNPEGLIFEKWYFQPTSLELFLQEWGDLLSASGSGPE